MEKQRAILIGAVDLVKNPLGHTGPIMLSICNELEPLLNEVGFTDNAPFRTIHLIFRYGKNNVISPPDYQNISKRHNELPLAIELDAFSLAKDDMDKVAIRLYEATIEVLRDVAEKYSLPFAELENLIERTNIVIKTTRD